MADVEVESLMAFTAAPFAGYQAENELEGSECRIPRGSCMGSAFWGSAVHTAEVTAKQQGQLMTQQEINLFVLLPEFKLWRITQLVAEQHEECGRGSFAVFQCMKTWSQAFDFTLYVRKVKISRSQTRKGFLVTFMQRIFYSFNDMHI